ncbi:MAG TPA: cyanophycin synthetase [Polyangiaceae bacterium]|nr:cyanophycin synthetase [Polyangiaceae bacterium]
MQIQQVRALKGPNIWTNPPVIEAVVALGRYEELPTNKLPGFTDRLMQWLPSLIEHRCSVGERGGFLKRLRDGTWLGHVLEHVTLELHSLAHTPVGFGRARETGEYGVYKVVVRCDEPVFGEACLRAARELVMAAAEGRGFELEPELKRLRDVAEKVCLGPGTQAIVDAARARGIPCLRLTDDRNLVQLGYGKAQRRIWTAETDGTAAVAESIAQDKDLTRTLLRSVGVPVPEGRVVKTAEDAWSAALEIGLPVVVKPQDGNYGRGVSIRLEERGAVEKAFQIAANEGTGVVVERFVPGSQYRVLVVGERAVAASGGEADHIVGDGSRSVAELVERANQDPARGGAYTHVKTTLVLDDISLELLRRQGMTPKSVPASGRTVVIHHNGDLTVDVTDRLSPDIAASCALAARTVGLDIAGMDVIAEDIARSFESQGGAVIEVNASPSLLMHLRPLQGKPRPVGEAIIDHMFGADQTGRVPLVAVTGSRRGDLVAGLVGRLVTAAGYNAGLVDSSGVRAGDHWLERGDVSRWAGAHRLLLNPFVNAFVFGVTEQSVLEEALAFDRCQVAVVTDVVEPPPNPKLEGPSHAWRALRTPVDVVLPTGFAVLNAEDAAVARMAEFCQGKVIYFAQSVAAQPLAAHFARGGAGVVLEDGSAVLRQGAAKSSLLDAATFAAARAARGDVSILDWLAVLATGVALGMTADAVKSGFLNEFDGRSAQGPEREATGVATVG